MGREHRCVECGYRVNSLFVQYSPGNIRLMKCENCKAVADEYIECELMIIFIDLILHKPKAYRHLLYNVLNQETMHIQHLSWKSAFAYLLLDAYRSLLLRRSDEDSGLSQTLFSTSTKVMINVLMGNFAFICTFALAVRIVLNVSVEASRRRDILSGILISSYFKIFLLAMMVIAMLSQVQHLRLQIKRNIFKVWEFPTSVIFIVDIFVLTSNAVALKVMTESAMRRCIAVCFIAHSARFLADQFTEVRSLRHLDL